MDRLRLTVFGLVALVCGLLFLGLTDASWRILPLHAALTFATALGTWWLASDDLALEGSGAMGRLVLTGVSLGLGLTWAGALIWALLDTGAGAAWTQGEFQQVFRQFIQDTAFHWTPLGLVAAFAGTGLSLVFDEISGTAAERDQKGQRGTAARREPRGTAAGRDRKGPRGI